MITTDLHMHSAFSADSEASPLAQIEAAIDKGLTHICFTDHIDYDFPDPECDLVFDFDMDEYFQVLHKLQKRFVDRICIGIGVEMGLQPHLNDRIRECTHKYPFDFVIGSSHVVKGVDPYYDKVWSRYSPREIYRAYFEEMLADINSITEFDVYGHLDYVTRYGQKFADGKNDQVIHDNMELIDQILRKLVYDGKGIEVNTSGLKSGLAFPNPNPIILKRYRELGGEILTVGADAHTPQYVGYRFDFAKDVIESCGFRYITRFEKRKPVFLSL